jgi:hypothetical protein
MLPPRQRLQQSHLSTYGYLRSAQPLGRSMHIRSPRLEIREWQRMIGECKIWCPSLYDTWITDFNLAWGEVPGAKFLCSRMRMDQKRGQTAEWSIYKVSQEIQESKTHGTNKSVRSGIICNRYPYILLSLSFILLKMLHFLLRVSRFAFGLLTT